MAKKNESELYCACRDGDLGTVRRLIPRTSNNNLTSLESNGSTCLHAAASNGHKEIVELIINHGVPRRIYDKDYRTPLDLAQTEEIRRYFRRSEEDAQERFSKKSTLQTTWRVDKNAVQNNSPSTDWLFGEDIAEEYSRAVEWGSIKNRGIEKTMRKFEKYGMIPTDESKESKLLRFYFNEAREKNDPTFLLKAYTVESPFYKYLNEYMATGGKSKVFAKLRGQWSGYYTGAIVKSPALDPYRFRGITYRGMEVVPQEIEQYHIGGVLTNKAFQSTSKEIQVAYRFACRERPTPGKVPLLLIYDIVDRRSAIDITRLSEYQDEEEVLLVPGTLFRVDDIDKSRTPFKIQLRQLSWNKE
jgi:hypothetical protein